MKKTASKYLLAGLIVGGAYTLALHPLFSTSKHDNQPARIITTQEENAIFSPLGYEGSFLTCQNSDKQNVLAYTKEDLEGDDDNFNNHYVKDIAPKALHVSNCQILDHASLNNLAQRFSLAVNNGSTQVMKDLLAQYAPVAQYYDHHFIGKNRSSTLIDALDNQNSDAVKLIVENLPKGYLANSIKNDDDIEYSDSLWKQTAYGHIDVMRALLTTASKEDAKALVAQASILNAIDSGNVDMVKLYVENGADTDFTLFDLHNNLTETPLTYAQDHATKDHPNTEVIEYLKSIQKK